MSLAAAGSIAGPPAAKPGGGGASSFIFALVALTLGIILAYALSRIMKMSTRLEALQRELDALRAAGDPRLGERVRAEIGLVLDQMEQEQQKYVEDQVVEEEVRYSRGEQSRSEHSSQSEQSRSEHSRSEHSRSEPQIFGFITAALPRKPSSMVVEELEDDAAPAPVPPASPVASAAPEAPASAVAPEAPASAVAPEAPASPVEPASPVAPEVEPPAEK